MATWRPFTKWIKGQITVSGVDKYLNLLVGEPGYYAWQDQNPMQEQWYAGPEEDTNWIIAYTGSSTEGVGFQRYNGTFNEAGFILFAKTFYGGNPATGSIALSDLQDRGMWGSWVVGSETLSLRYDAESSSTACANRPTTYYGSKIFTEMAEGDIIYDNVELTVVSADGYYSNGVIYKQMEGGKITGEPGECGG